MKEPVQNERDICVFKDTDDCQEHIKSNYMDWSCIMNKHCSCQEKIDYRIKEISE